MKSSQIDCDGIDGPMAETDVGVQVTASNLAKNLVSGKHGWHGGTFYG